MAALRASAARRLGVPVRRIRVTVVVDDDDTVVVDDDDTVVTDDSDTGSVTGTVVRRPAAKPEPDPVER